MQFGASEAIQVQLHSIWKSKFMMAYERMKKNENDNTLLKNQADGD